MPRIGNIDIKYRLMPAPLAGLTDIVFRKLLDEIGCVDYMVTEMISAEGLRRKQEKTLHMIRPGDFRTPQFIQLFGSEPEPFIDSVKYIENETQFAGIDINMGCPAPKVIRKGGGSALLRTPGMVAAIVREIKKNTRLPLTVKIRLGFNTVNVEEIASILHREGADAVAVHFRLCTDGYRGIAKWEHVPAVRHALKDTFFIGNGDLKTVSSVREKLDMVDAVMIGRGAVVNPLIFAQTSGNDSGTISLDWAARRLVELVEEYYPEKMQLPQIKAYARYLFSNRSHSKRVRQRIYQSHSFREAGELFAIAFSQPEVIEPE